MDNNINIQKNSAGQGAGWFNAGFRLFRRNPGAWVGAILLYLLIGLLVSIVPVIGGIASALLDPIFFGGLMLGCAAQMHGESFKVDYLFQGFSNQVRQLFNLGLLFLGLSLACSIPALLLGWGGLALNGMNGSAADVELTTLALGGLISLALYVPVLMGYWLAPPLIVEQKLGAWTAFKLSFRGSLRNIAPALVYGLVVMLWALVGALPLGLGLFIVIPSVVASIYIAYQNIFKTDNNLV